MDTRPEPLVDLLERVADRFRGVVAGEERVRALLDAVVAVGGDLDLIATLQRIVTAAAHLADAEYVALGMLNRDGDGLNNFITHGLSPELRAQIGPLPQGHGILGLLIRDATPIRLRDLSAHPASFGFPEHHPPMSSFLGVPVRVHGRVFGNLYLTGKRGALDFTDEDEQAIVALASTAAVAVENARLYEEVRQQQRWVAATAEIQQMLLRRADRDEVLSLVAGRAREIAGADVALVVLAQDDGAFRVEAFDGVGGDLTGVVLPGGGALTDVVRRSATVHLTAGVEVSGLDGIASALIVPLTESDDADGALLIGSATPQGNRWLDDAEVDGLRGFAAHVALALARAQAQEVRAALAILADRDRIARDLHDLVIQRLFGTGLLLQAAQRLPSPDKVSQALGDAVGELDATIREIRGTIFELGRANGVPGDFLGAFRDAVRTAAAGLGFPPRLELIGPLDTAIPDAVRPHLLAVVVEALSNATRHAAAEHVHVRMSIEGSPATGSVVLTVRDDGTGLPEHTRDSGLRNLRDRAAGVGGSCVVESAPGGGTSLRWAAPLARPALDPGVPGRGTGPPDEAQPEVTKDGRSWQIGTSDEVAWIAAGTAIGSAITSAIPPVFAAYATFFKLDESSIAGHERAVVQHLADHSGDQPWWLGYLDTGAHDVVFDDAARVTLYTGWDYVLVQAGPAQSLTWRTGHMRAGDGSLPDLIFPADRSWLVSGLWDDTWTCVGGPAELIADLQRDHQVRARRVELGEDATPPGHEML